MLVVISVENQQKSRVECFLEVLSVRNVFPVVVSLKRGGCGLQIVTSIGVIVMEWSEVRRPDT